MSHVMGSKSLPKRIREGAVTLLGLLAMSGLFSGEGSGELAAEYLGVAGPVPGPPSSCVCESYDAGGAPPPEHPAWVRAAWAGCPRPREAGPGCQAPPRGAE
jgi:hypothetical protein